MLTKHELIDEAVIASSIDSDVVFFDGKSRPGFGWNVARISQLSVLQYIHVIQPGLEVVAPVEDDDLRFWC